METIHGMDSLWQLVRVHWIGARKVPTLSVLSKDPVTSTPIVIREALEGRNMSTREIHNGSAQKSNKYANNSGQNAIIQEET